MSEVKMRGPYSWGKFRIADMAMRPLEHILILGHNKPLKESITYL
jgi:hypothetical protein